METALGHALAQDVIDGVKAAVVMELEGLDSAADIRTTEYFNHSYAPDIVLTWRENGRESVRNIFLRYSLGSAAAGRDIEALGEFGPVLLGLREEHDPGIINEVRAEVAEAPRVLATDIRSLDDITDHGANGGSRALAAVGSAREPLLRLVRGSVMRGGRGLFISESDDVAALTGASGEAHDEVAGLDAFNAVVRNLFVEDAAARLIRAGQMLRMGISGDTADLSPSPGDDPDEPSGVVRGSLSEAELMVVLPYLLSRDDVTDDPRYWAYVGSMISLKRLEDMAAGLLGLNLTRLVVPNLEHWSAARASAGLNVDSLDEAPTDWRDGWYVRAGMLALNAGAHLISLTSDRRKISGRKDSAAARWEDLAEPLSRFALNAVTLQGLLRRVRVQAERSDDVYRDVDTITSNLDDTFRVPDVEVRVPTDPTGSVITADFTRMIAESATSAPASTLVRVARELLAHTRSG
ncbi:hypothetical protein [Actinoplanes sp. NPDC049118]|uniref:hypothetical protein n=1 Tax=Actinoplanes sp. NPDC049118 TaxID=3155769 RepID=UPI0033EC31AD